MARFRNRVGRVSTRQRAIAASLLAKSIVGGIKTKTLAVHQGITPRRALTVLRYAELQGWVFSAEHKHRNNAFSCWWLVGGRNDRVLFDDTAVGEKDEALGLCAAYRWGRDEKF